MSVVIPYIEQARPDTGVTNGKLGIWLFLASEIMLFGAFFSSYIFLRVGAKDWETFAYAGHPVEAHAPAAVVDGAAAVGHQRHASPLHAGVKLATLNTVVLITSSITMVLAWAALATRRFGRGRFYLALTIGLALLFLVIKYGEYAGKLAHGYVPGYSPLLALYWTMTGLHVLHVIGGIVVLGYLLGPGSRLWHQHPLQYTNRVENTGLYWHFVDLVWIFLFPTLYLM